MKNTNNSKQANDLSDNVNGVVDNNGFDGRYDDKVGAVAAMYKKEESRRKIALLCSLMGNVMFLVTTYAVLCYDTTGRLLGQLLGVNQ